MILKGLPVLFSFIFLLLFFSCTKVNEATDIGGDLLPAVDNIHTFDTTINVGTAYHPFEDTTKNFISDYMALGKLNDPVFGTTNADMYFNLSSQAYGTYPFGTSKDAIKVIDSVILSLAYVGAYGDTTASQISVQVSEIAPSNTFIDTVVYPFNQPAFPITGSVLGTKTFSTLSFKDSMQITRVGDTSTRVANVLRIPLNTSIATKLISFDTSSTSVNGGYSSDSAFRKLFRGLAIRTTGIIGQGALAYFNLSDVANSKLIIYYKVDRSGVIDSAASVSFVHSSYSQANSITRNPGGDYLANINNATSQNLYLQSSPSGSYIGIKIPNLEAFPNKIINRAELIAYTVPSLADNYFTVPATLFLDHKGALPDSSYFFQNDITTNSDGTYNYTGFGGTIHTDNSYRFNITRYVQGIVTRKDRNDSLRLYAPFRAQVYNPATKLVLVYPYNNVLDNIAKGRVVLASGNYSNPSMRLRLHIVYSNL